jgi:hypothetical protein
MGDRYTYYYDCPKCGKKNGVEVYNAPSCLMYYERCEHCDYRVNKNYYETDEHTISMMTDEEADKQGYRCKLCKELCLNFDDIKNHNSICWICRDVDPKGEIK